MARMNPARMPACEMARIVMHWTAGAHTASALDREHYHVLVEGDGTVVYGTHDIAMNAKPAREPRASHTRNCNTGSIGVAVCCMKDARERPFAAGPFPMTQRQWEVAAEVVAELCDRYGIEVTPRTVLAHGEVQANLHIEQLGKWDPMVQPWNPSKPRQQVMDEFRAAVRSHLTTLAPPPALAAAAAAGAPAAATPHAPQPQTWQGDSAVLLVHGVGNAAPGDYTDVAAAVGGALGTTAVYSLFYDVYNDWFREKTDFANQIQKVTGFIRSQQPQGALGDTIAETAGDVLWPLFSTGARASVTTAYRAMLRQMLQDGVRSTGLPMRDLRIGIICHSLGCFHTYEILHSIATDPTLNLRPLTDGVRFRTVVFMASPVQLIRTLAQSLGGVVPSGLATTLASGLAIPSEQAHGVQQASVNRWVSITGNLDPIGGHFVRRKADWAYMDVAGAAEQIVDKQTITGSGTEEENLFTILRTALSQGRPPAISIENPHSWLGYIERHKTELAGWLA
jgi:hypothetical protein